jgi:thioredoxin reductase (NADPH)
LINKEVPYVNAFACFKDPKTIVFSSEKSEIEKFLADNQYTSESLGEITSEYSVIATGGRPSFLEDSQCLNMKKYALSSDDLFSLKKPPGKTLVVGGGYIALECAGFLNTIGYDTSIMTRGPYLRSKTNQKFIFK